MPIPMVQAIEGCKIVTRTPFTFSNVRYQTDEVFPYEELNVPWRKVLQLINARKVRAVPLEKEEMERPSRSRRSKQ